jgi:hypothetical protein
MSQYKYSGKVQITEEIRLAIIEQVTTSNKFMLSDKMLNKAIYSLGSPYVDTLYYQDKDKQFYFLITRSVRRYILQMNGQPKK